jgi:CarD family transcriptional regulator
MYNIGDLIIYSAHGICKIDDICEKTISGSTTMYYVLHPIENSKYLSISIPVQNDKVVMLDLLEKEEAHEILESFKEPGIKWTDKPNLRYSLYNNIVTTGDRKEIAKMVNTLLMKQNEADLQGKKLYEQDRKLLDTAQNILFKEMAISLNTTWEDINEMVQRRLEKMK